MKTMKVANTPLFLALAQDADKHKRNRRVKTEKLVDALDPDGTHVIAMAMLHNDVEMRCVWLLKMKDTMVPTEVELDVSLKNYHILPDQEVSESA